MGLDMENVQVGDIVVTRSLECYKIIEKKHIKGSIGYPYNIKLEDMSSHWYIHHTYTKEGLICSWAHSDSDIIEIKNSSKSTNNQNLKPKVRKYIEISSETFGEF